MSNLSGSNLWMPKHYRDANFAVGDAPAAAAGDDDFWVPGAETPVDDAGNRVGPATWVPRADATNIPDFVWRRIPAPTGWRILVQEWAPPRSRKIAGTDKEIYFADESSDYHRAGNYIGRVLAMGPLCYRHPKFTVIGDDGQKALGAPWCRVGQWITFAQYTGTPRKIKHDGEEYTFRFTFDENIEGVAPTPHGLKVYAA